MLFIGDVHGKYAAYKRIIKQTSASIQVGDMGVGFIRHNRMGDIHYLANPPHQMIKEHKAQFIRGNHDNPGVCRRHSQWIPDGYIDGDVMFIGGAYSIDRMYRTEGYDWWPDEQLSIKDLNWITDDYLKLKPKVMVTHDCPHEIGRLIHSHHFFDEITRTGQALQTLWQAHQPDLWIFGHHHKSFDQVALGTRFVCLAELEAKDFDVPLGQLAPAHTPQDQPLAAAA